MNAIITTFLIHLRNTVLTLGALVALVLIFALASCEPEPIRATLPPEAEFEQERYQALLAYEQGKQYVPCRDHLLKMVNTDTARQQLAVCEQPNLAGGRNGN